MVERPLLELSYIEVAFRHAHDQPDHGCGCGVHREERIIDRIIKRGFDADQVHIVAKRHARRGMVDTDMRREDDVVIYIDHPVRILPTRRHHQIDRLRNHFVDLVVVIGFAASQFDLFSEGRVVDKHHHVGILVAILTILEQSGQSADRIEVPVISLDQIGPHTEREVLVSGSGSP